MNLRRGGTNVFKPARKIDNPDTRRGPSPFRRFTVPRAEKQALGSGWWLRERRGEAVGRKKKYDGGQPADRVASWEGKCRSFFGSLGDKEDTIG